MKPLEESKRILINTHRKDCMDLLGIRDYFMDKARFASKIYYVILLLPLIFILITNLPIFENFTFISKYKDIFSGILTVLAFIITKIINLSISKNLYISNAMREEYDVRVFEIESNHFAYSDINTQDYLHIAEKIPYNQKYETWYTETFSSDKNKNILCSQMDNILYGIYVHKDNHRIAQVSFYFSCVLALILSLAFFIFDKPLTTILLLFSMFDICSVLYEIERDTKSILETLIKISNKVKKDITSPDFKITSSYLRIIQDEIINTRNAPIFIFKFIRFKHLGEEPAYLKDLDEIKAILYGENDTFMIESADDIPVLAIPEATVPTCAENLTLTDMNTIHARLLDMLKNVTEALERRGITYFLDGGTLLGTVRSKGRMLFWDDDIDISIPIEQLENAKQVLTEQLSALYNIQSCETDEFYSYRLANFRVREKNNQSQVFEKDSPLYKKYNFKGLFMDVYSYCPIFICPMIDKLFRRLFFYPLNRKLKKTENKISLKKNNTGAIEKFHKYQAAYKNKMTFYLKIAKCTDYFSYTPNYIESYSSVSYYFKRSDLYPNAATDFEGILCNIPNNPQNVLKSYYGDNWNTCPHKTKKELIGLYKQRWFSHNKFRASSLKHLIYVTLDKNAAK